MSHIDHDAMTGESLPYLSANASSAACFEFKESRDAPVETFAEVEGVILGAWRGNACWQTKNGPFPGLTVVCKAHDAKQPATLSKDVTEAHRDTLRVRGWTGNCESCGMSAKVSEGGYPGFKPENHLVFLWRKPGASEPIAVLLSFKGWKGYLASGGFLARFRSKNSTDYVVRFKMEKRREGDNNYSVPVGTEVGPVEPDMRAEMASLADYYVGAARYRAPAAVASPTPRPSLPAATHFTPTPADVVEVDDIPF